MSDERSAAIEKHDLLLPYSNNERMGNTTEPVQKLIIRHNQKRTAVYTQWRKSAQKQLLKVKNQMLPPRQLI